MTFKIEKPALVPVRGTQLIKPIEALNMGVHLLSRTVGDPLQSAVRLGELTELGLLKTDANNNLVVGDGIWTETSSVYRGKFTGGARSMIQSSVPNGATNLDLIPNGTGLLSYFTARGRPDVNNFQYTQIGIDFGTPTIRFGAFGTEGNPAWLDVFNNGNRIFRFAADGSAHGLYSFTVGQLAGDGTGWTTLNRGNATNPGYISFHTNDGTRRGFIGWNSGANNLQVVAETGWTYRFNADTYVDATFHAQGALFSEGVGAALYTHDRTTGRPWAWYTQGEIMRLYNTLGGDVLIADLNTGSWSPNVDGGWNNGHPSKRWATVYAVTGAINTSDARDKTPVSPCSELELDAAKLLAKEVGFYQWLDMVAEKGASAARLHCGMTVQRAIEIMTSCGLDPMRYGFICYDSWPTKELITEEVPPVEAEYDSEGMLVVTARDGYTKIIQEAQAGGDRYSFRMDELMLFIARGFEARLSALEEA